MPAENESCPCGATVKPDYQAIDYIVEQLMPDIIPDLTQRRIYLPLIFSFLQQTFDLSALCFNPRIPRPRDFGPFDWINPAIGAALAYDWLRYRMYELVCDCTDCPPITDCGQGECFTVGSGNGYYPDPEQPAVIEYTIPEGTYYVRREDNACLGPYAGLYIRWHVGGVFDPTNAVCVKNYNETGATCWSQNVLSGTVEVCAGGAVQPPHQPWPETDVDIEPFPGPPACSTSDICTALEYVYETISEIRFLTQVIAGPLYGITTPIAVTMPGIQTPITGVLTEVLPRLFAAIAPITPAQLSDPAVTNIDTSSVVDVSNLAYLQIVLTTVPAAIGSYGLDETVTYYNRRNSPAPGYVLVMGQSGVLAHHAIMYGAGIEFAIPATATDLAIHLEPGVEIALTTYERTV